jgi:hypothetical protein
LHDLEGAYIRRRVSYHKLALLNLIGVPLKLSEAHTFLGVFAKLRKSTINVAISVCLSLLKKQLGSQWTDFYEIWCFCIFRKSVAEVQVTLKCDKNNGYFTGRHFYIDDNVSLNSS